MILIMGCNIFLLLLVYVEAKFKDPTKDSMLRSEVFDDLSILFILIRILVMFLSDKDMVLFVKSNDIPK